MFFWWMLDIATCHPIYLFYIFFSFRDKSIHFLQYSGLFRLWIASFPVFTHVRINAVLSLLTITFRPPVWSVFWWSLPKQNKSRICIRGMTLVPEPRGFFQAEVLLSGKQIPMVSSKTSEKKYGYPDWFRPHRCSPSPSETMFCLVTP